MILIRPNRMGTMPVRPRQTMSMRRNIIRQPKDSSPEEENEENDIQEGEAEEEEGESEEEREEDGTKEDKAEKKDGKGDKKKAQEIQGSIVAKLGNGCSKICRYCVENGFRCEWRQGRRRRSCLICTQRKKRCMQQERNENDTKAVCELLRQIVEELKDSHESELMMIEGIKELNGRVQVVDDKIAAFVAK